jgi:photosystem II stability/assembly factor-like uncharacterized protein
MRLSSEVGKAPRLRSLGDGRRSKAERRRLFFERQRGLPDASRSPEGTVPSRAVAATRRGVGGPPKLPYLRAFRSRRKRAVAPAAAPPLWQPLGPTLIREGQTYGTARTPVSGRVSRVALDPGDEAHILLATAGGGVWETRDGGQTWAPRTDFQPTLSTGAIAFAPSDTRIVYCGTGEGDTSSQLGVGVLRSSDGGTTWALRPHSLLEGVGFYDIVVDPGDADHLWAGTFRHLLESRDGGARWRAVRSGCHWTIALRPGNPKEMLVASDRGLALSKNGGRTWKAIGLGGLVPRGDYDRMAVAYAPSDGRVVYAFAAIGDAAYLWRRATSNGPFVRQELPDDLDVTQAWYDWCLAVQADDPNVVYLGAIELYRGRRSGASWTWRNVSSRRVGDSIHPDQHAIVTSPGRPRLLLVGNDGGVFRSRDRGGSWESLNPGLGITEFEFLAQHPTSTSWILGGTQDNGTLRHKGNGEWEHVADGDGGDCGIDEVRPDACYHSYYGMGLERSDRRGDRDSWFKVGPSSGLPSLFYPPFEARGRILAQAGSDLMISTTGGQPWTNVPIEQTDPGNDTYGSALAIPADDRILVGTTYGEVYEVSLGPGGAAVRLLGQPRRAAFVSDIHVDPSNPAVIWVSYSTIGGPSVFCSRDGGRTWSSRTSDLPRLPVNAVFVDPADGNVVYVGTDNGVYRSADSGSTWTDFSSGLPNAIVGDLVFLAPQRLLRVGTRNRGVWQVKL